MSKDHATSPEPRVKAPAVFADSANFTDRLPVSRRYGRWRELGVPSLARSAAPPFFIHLSPPERAFRYPGRRSW